MIKKKEIIDIISISEKVKYALENNESKRYVVIIAHRKVIIVNSAEEVFDLLNEYIYNYMDVFIEDSEPLPLYSWEVDKYGATTTMKNVYDKRLETKGQKIRSAFTNFLNSMSNK